MIESFKTGFLRLGNIFEPFKGRHVRLVLCMWNSVLKADQIKHNFAISDSNATKKRLVGAVFVALCCVS